MMVSASMPANGLYADGDHVRGMAKTISRRTVYIHRPPAPVDPPGHERFRAVIDIMQTIASIVKLPEWATPARVHLSR